MQPLIMLPQVVGGPHLANQANMSHLAGSSHRAIPGMGAMGHVSGGLVSGALGGLAAGDQCLLCSITSC